jgi:hypothetical protein
MDGALSVKYSANKYKDILDGTPERKRVFSTLCIYACSKFYCIIFFSQPPDTFRKRHDSLKNFEKNAKKKRQKYWSWLQSKMRDKENLPL